MVVVGHFEASAKLKQTLPLELMLTRSLLVTGQLDTFVCNHFTLLSLRSGGTNVVLDPPLESPGVEVSGGVVVAGGGVVPEVLSLSSTTPADDLPAVQSKGQHQ